MSRTPDSAAHYVHAVLAAYRSSPDVLGRVRPADRRLAEALHRMSVPLHTVEEALLLAVARRQAGQMREPIRSLHYFRPIIDELLRTPLPPGYADYLRQRLSKAVASEGALDAGPKNNGS